LGPISVQLARCAVAVGMRLRITVAAKNFGVEAIIVDSDLTDLFLYIS
jgi:polysaccharide pyruvyl transferase WcaK-like protein